MADDSSLISHSPANCTCSSDD